MTTNRKDTRMRGLRPTEGRVDRSCKGDGEPNNGRLGYPVVTPSFYNSYINPNSATLTLAGTLDGCWARCSSLRIILLLEP